MLYFGTLLYDIHTYMNSTINYKMGLLLRSVQFVVKLLYHRKKSAINQRVLCAGKYIYKVCITI